ncbi:(d)CMP kinase [Bacteroidota bacterium]
MIKNNPKPIIAVDGFSSSGKSTFAKAIAKELNLLYIDSGAMYRAVTYACIKNNCIQSDNTDNLILYDIIANIDIQFIKNKETGNIETYLDNENIEMQIRDIEVSNNVSAISTIGEVRKRLVELQRSYSANTGVVMDGRDIGTTVFPNADLKIFMTASVDIRAQRRYKELIEKGLSVNYEEIKQNIEKRDHIDQTRDISPLKKAEDAIELDNSYMTPNEQMDWFLKLIN